MIVTSIILIKIFLLSFVITKFEPLQWILESLETFFSKNTFLSLIYKLLLVASSCLKCMSLYIGFILGGFWIGILSSFLGYLYMKTLDPYLERITLPKINFNID